MKKALIYGLIGLAVIVVIILVAPSSKNSTPTPPSGPSSTTTSSPNSTPPPVSSKKSSSSGSATQTPKNSAPKSSPQSIFITSPVSGDIFVINNLSNIKWSSEPGVTGGLYLVDVATNATLGWITPSTGPHQTSYSWDVRDIALTRVSGIKKPVLPGFYSIGLKLDRPGTDAKSAPFFILFPEQDKTFTHNVSIQSFRFNPSSITVKIGEKINIQNKDQIAYVLTSRTGSEPLTLAPGETKTIATDNFTEGTYGYYSSAYTATNINIDVHR